MLTAVVRRATIRAFPPIAGSSVLISHIHLSSSTNNDLDLMFSKDFSAPDPVPEDGIRRAVEIMRSGRVFRYQGGESEASLFEEQLASYLGRNYVVGLNSCGSAMFMALKAAGVNPGDAVLVNAYTLTPVPSSIVHAGGVPVLIEMLEDYTIDLDDLRSKAKQSGAKYLLLSHMRGRVPDMDAITKLCEDCNLIMIEDCAHSLGGRWGGKPVGTFGAISCFSAQTNKSLNSGEGGFVSTDDDAIAARVILNSGSYGLFAGHTSRPDRSVFEEMYAHTPNFSMRLTNTAAAMLIPQLAELDEKVKKFNTKWFALAEQLCAGAQPHLVIPPRHTSELIVGSSLQFSLPNFTYEQVTRVVEGCEKRGVPLAWFGRQEWNGFTSTYRHWKYISSGAAASSPDIAAKQQQQLVNHEEHNNGVQSLVQGDTGAGDDPLPRTRAVLATLLDLPLYHTAHWEASELDTVGRIICAVVCDVADSSGNSSS